MTGSEQQAPQPVTPVAQTNGDGHPARLKNQRQRLLPWYDSVRRRGARLRHSGWSAEPCRREIPAGILDQDRPASERENEQGKGRRQMDFSRLNAIQVFPNYCAVAGQDLYPLAVAGYPIRKAIIRGARVESDSTLPYNCHAPVHVQKRPDCRQVALSIGGEFRIPEVCSCLRQPEERATRMAMPEAPVYKHRSLPLRKHKVRLSREGVRMKSKAEAARPKLPSDNDLRRSVLGPDSRHQR